MVKVCGRCAQWLNYRCPVCGHTPLTEGEIADLKYAPRPLGLPGGRQPLAGTVDSAQAQKALILETLSNTLAEMVDHYEGSNLPPELSYPIAETVERFEDLLDTLMRQVAIPT